MVTERALRLYKWYAPITLGKRYIVRRAIHASRKSPATRIVVTKRGVRLLVETDDLIQGYIYLFGVWEPNITDWIRRTLLPGDTFVDVGSNIGYYSTLAARLVGSAGSVVAIDGSCRRCSRPPWRHCRKSSPGGNLSRPGLSRSMWREWSSPPSWA